jgi:hypothetical protein
MWNVECHRSGARNEQRGAWVFDVTSDVLHSECSAAGTPHRKGVHALIAVFSGVRAAERPQSPAFARPCGQATNVPPVKHVVEGDQPDLAQRAKVCVHCDCYHFALYNGKTRLSYSQYLSVMLHNILSLSRHPCRLSSEGLVRSLTSLSIFQIQCHGFFHILGNS